MANKSNTKDNKKKNVAPIKVEKIVDTPDNSKKEVFAIIIGILVVAALVVGSVIYFKGKEKDPLVDDKKKPDAVDVIDEPEEPTEEKEKEEKAKVVKLSATTDNKKKPSSNVTKECTTCTVVAVDGYDVGGAKFNSKNQTTTTVYYTNEEDSYVIKVTGTVKATAADFPIAYTAGYTAMATHIINENNITDEELDNFALGPIKFAIDMAKTTGTIVVTSDDTKVVTHTFTIRIEEKDQVDWTKGVTVNGITYNETVLNTDGISPFTYQDEAGINIIVGVSADDLGPDAPNAPITFDVAYTTKNGNEVESSYELDLTELEIDYETSEETDENGTPLGDTAITEEFMENYEDMMSGVVEWNENMVSDILDDIRDTGIPMVIEKPEETETPVVEEATVEETVETLTEA